MKHGLSSAEQWLPQYGDVLYRYALIRVRDRELAADLVQDTFLAALKAQDSFMGQAGEQTWLVGILKHKMMDFFRKSSWEKTEAMGDGLPDNQFNDFFDRLGSWQIDLSTWSKPDKSLEQKEFMPVL